MRRRLCKIRVGRVERRALYRKRPIRPYAHFAALKSSLFSQIAAALSVTAYGSGLLWLAMEGNCEGFECGETPILPIRHARSHLFS